jgi:hypothetical protein
MAVLYKDLKHVWLLDTANDKPINLSQGKNEALDWMKSFKILHLFCLTEDNPLLIDMKSYENEWNRIMY